MSPTTAIMSEVADPLTHLKRLSIVVVLAIGVFALATTPPVNAARSPQTGPVPLLLTGVTGTPLSFVVIAKSTNCASEPCLQLQRTSDNGAHFTTLHLPPTTSARDLGELFFANSVDGYARLNVADTVRWYVTTNGAQSWHRESIAPGLSTLQLIPARRELYAVIARCVKKHACTSYRIARTPLTATKWSVSALPAPLSRGGFALAAYDSNVWANLQDSQVPLLFTSHNDGRTFSQMRSAPLANVLACDVTPMSPTSLWAECPTGMLVSFFYSADAGVHWTRISRYSYSGTGGGAFDPVSSALAYLNFGPVTSRAEGFYAITDSGHRMTAVGNLACTSTPSLVFSNATLGLAICQKNYSTAPTSTYLLRTSNGGKSWTRVTLK